MIFSLITVYNPKSLDEVKRNISAIASQVDKIFICDNSTFKTQFEFLPNNAVHLFFNKNLGLSMAFNRVLKNNDFSDDDYIIFFDQDSFIGEGYIHSLRAIHEELENGGIKVGLLCPVAFNVNDNKVIPIDKNHTVADGCYEVTQMLTSSSLCKFKALKEVGFWNENVFLDLADFDLSWRIRAFGFKNIRTDRLLFNHTYGDGVKKIGPLQMTVEAPVREYYQMRESLYLFYKKYVPFKYKIRLFRTITFRPFFRIFFLDEKKKRAFYIFRGYKDFVKKKKGEIEMKNLYKMREIV